MAQRLTALKIIGNVIATSGTNEYCTKERNPMNSSRRRFRARAHRMSYLTIVV